jgi:hypothetical protein
MAWTLRLAPSSSSNMIDIDNGKQRTWRVWQQVRAHAHGSTLLLMAL